jgi:hypothetical protein
MAIVNECVLWEGSRNEKGYGRAWRNGRHALAHRAAWEDAFGPIPAGFDLHHICRNRLCIALDHLRLVSHKENVTLDAAERCRPAEDDQSDGARFRRWRISRGMSQADAAATLGISQALISLWELNAHPARFDFERGEVVATQCVALRRWWPERGRRCRGTALVDSDFCWVHDPRSRERVQASAATAREARAS